MNGDPLLVGVTTSFPNQNSSTVPTVWEEDTDQAAQQGIPCGTGTMLRLTRRSSNQQFLPGGALNPCAENAPSCLLVENLRVTAGASQRLSASIVAVGLVGGQFLGGVPGLPGLGLAGIGAPGDGVRGIAAAGPATGHGVAGFTEATSLGRAGVHGEAIAGAIGVQGRSSEQAVRGDGGSFGVVGVGTATGVDGAGEFGVVGRGTATGVEAVGNFGVVGRGTTVGAFGTAPGAGGVGVVGIGGVVGVRGDGRGASSGIGVEGIPGPLSGGIIPWAGAFRGSVRVDQDLFVNGGLFVMGTPKSSVVEHPDGSDRVMYAVEAAGSWFEDVGRAQLRNGVARVEADPDFAAVTRLGDDYHVFLTPEGPSNGLYVTDRSSSGFEVREQAEGTAEISFSYRIMTPRTDARHGRLERLERPPSAEAGLVDLVPELPGSPTALPREEPPVSGEAPPTAPPRASDVLQQRPPSGWPVDTVPWPPDIVAP